MFEEKKYLTLESAKERAKWDKKILGTPLWIPEFDRSTEFDRRVKQGLPIAWHNDSSSSFDMDDYNCQLTSMEKLPEEAQHEIRGIFELAFSRWRMDKKLTSYQQRQLGYQIGPNTIYLWLCPKDELKYIHDAVCHVLARYFPKERSSNEPKTITGKELMEMDFLPMKKV